MKRFFAMTLTILMLATLIGCGQKEITDGSYTVEVTLSGGSGRASVESPCKVMIADGQATATIIWSVVTINIFGTMKADGSSILICPPIPTNSMTALTILPARSGWLI